MHYHVSLTYYTHDIYGFLVVILIQERLELPTSTSNKKLTNLANLVTYQASHNNDHLFPGAW